MPEIVVTSSRRDINNSMDVSNNSEGSPGETTSTALAQGNQRAAITSATKGLTAIAEATGTSRSATSKGTPAAAGIVEAIGTLYQQQRLKQLCRNPVFLLTMQISIGGR